MPPRILVLGAGVVGLSSAVCIQQACPQAQVQVVAEHFSPDTTSDGSAGFWEPYLLGKADPERSLRMCEATYQHLMNLAKSPLASDVKVQKLSGYHLYKDTPIELEPFWKNIVDGFRELTKKELGQDQIADSGTFHTTLSVDVAPYMEWLMKRFKAQGGDVRQARVENIEEVASECDILINCSALSAKHLFKDEGVYPARGQVWKVSAPWIKHFYFMKEKGKETTYILPGVDFVTVGGTAQVDDWNTQADPVDAARIWDKAVSHFPFLKVIHNYGHGGSGITMHWGCAMEVTRLVMEALGTDGEDAQRIISRL